MAQSGDKLVLRGFKPDDYDEYASWWGEYNPPWKESLPKLGLIAGDMKAAGFVAQTDCDFAIITWWHTNPKNKARETYEYLNVLFLGLCEMAKRIGKNKVFCYCNIRSVVKILEKIGFRNYDGHLILEM